MDAKFKVGDVVEKIDGTAFTNGEYQVTLSNRYERSIVERWWLKEPATHILANALRLYKQPAQYSAPKSNGGSTDYYNIPPGAKDLQDLIEHNDMNFSEGNVFKAVYRMGKKTGTDKAYDWNKIIWFAHRELARLK